MYLKLGLMFHQWLVITTSSLILNTPPLKR